MMISMRSMIHLMATILQRAFFAFAFLQAMPAYIILFKHEQKCPALYHTLKTPGNMTLLETKDSPIMNNGIH